MPLKRVWKSWTNFNSKTLTHIDSKWKWEQASERANKRDMKTLRKRKLLPNCIKWNIYICGNIVVVMRNVCSHVWRSCVFSTWNTRCFLLFGFLKSHERKKTVPTMIGVQRWLQQFLFGHLPKHTHKIPQSNELNEHTQRTRIYATQNIK